MDDHQRRMWHRMIDVLDHFKTSEADERQLGTLTQDLRGLFLEADTHDPRIRDRFELLWSKIDAVHELWTAPWSPGRPMSVERLEPAVQALRAWAQTVVDDDLSANH